MPQPTYVLQLDAGTHWICSCGQSQNLPYCDGTHQGSAFQPLALELTESATVEISGSIQQSTRSKTA